MDEKQTLTVSISIDRRMKELQSQISMCQMLIEMSQNEMIQIQENAKTFLSKQQVATTTGPIEPGKN